MAIQFSVVTYRRFKAQPSRLLNSLAVAFALWAGAASAAERLLIFDAHVHYSRDAWEAFDPAMVMDILDAAGVPRALVSSTPDDGTLRLFEASPGRVAPVLRPYRSSSDRAGWFRDPEVVAYLRERLERGIYRGIGEFHLHSAADAGTDEMKAIVAMAVSRDIVLHVHSGAAPVRALFAIDPNLKILWAHAGMSEPPDVVVKTLADFPRLWAEVSFRAGDINPGGALDPAWREVFLRFPDRIMIGSDTYVSSRWNEYGALIDAHRRWLDQLPREVAKAIASGNAARLFGWAK